MNRALRDAELAAAVAWLLGLPTTDLRWVLLRIRIELAERYRSDLETVMRSAHSTVASGA